MFYLSRNATWLNWFTIETTSLSEGIRESFNYYVTYNAFVIIPQFKVCFYSRCPTICCAYPPDIFRKNPNTNPCLISALFIHQIWHCEQNAADVCKHQRLQITQVVTHPIYWYCRWPFEVWGLDDCDIRMFTLMTGHRQGWTGCRVMKHCLWWVQAINLKMRFLRLRYFFIP